MPRFTVPTGRRPRRKTLEEMEGRLLGLEKEYGLESGGEEETGEGVFGARGFLGNISDFYGMRSWGDWWRNTFAGESRTPQQERERYTVYPEWGAENIRELRRIMEE